MLTHFLVPITLRLVQWLHWFMPHVRGPWGAWESCVFEGQVVAFFLLTECLAGMRAVRFIWQAFEKGYFWNTLGLRAGRIA